MNPNSISITGKISESNAFVLGISQLLHFSSMETRKKAVQMPWQFLGLRNEFYANQTHSPEVGGKDLSRILKSTVKKLHDVCSHPSHIPMECQGLTVENPPRFSPWSGWKPHGRRTSDFSLFSFSTAASLKWMKFQGGKKAFLGGNFFGCCPFG